MSGIFGYIQTTSIPKRSSSQLLLWNQAYGQTSQKIHEEKNYVLGCCYEHITNAPALSNPILECNHKYSVIDAILYNRDELINTCNLPATLSDEELLLRYIDCLGINALKDVNGDFCGAIYDTQTQILTLFRDHLGIRPLFYYTDKEQLIFSTDIRGLTALPNTQLDVDEEWIYRTLIGSSTLSAERTEYSHTFCVPPSGYIQYSIHNNHCTMLAKKSYWQLGSHKIHLSSEQEYQSKLRELITDSVHKRLSITSDLVGAELSGGLDSGVIDLIISKAGRECTYYSWSMDPASLPLVEQDERLVIKDICEQENITCHYCPPQLDFDSESNIAKTMQTMGIAIDYDKLNTFRYILPVYANTPYLLQTAQFLNQKGAKIVFTGHGGDEGVSHRSDPYEIFYHKEYYHFFRQMWLTTQGKRHRILKSIKYSYNTLFKNRPKLLAPYSSITKTPELLSGDFSQKYASLYHPPLCVKYDPTSYIRSGGSRNRLDNIALYGAYSGIRYVVPYLDYRVIDFALSIPRYLFWHGESNRHIFREAFKDIMPASLYKQSLKQELSRINKPKDPNRFIKFHKKQLQTVVLLPKEYWSKILNYKVIDEWLSHTKNADSIDIHDEFILFSLLACASSQNVLDRTREIYEQNTKKERENADS